MPADPDLFELRTERMRSLVRQLERELGGGRGWKVRAAQLLGVHPSYVSRLLAPQGGLRVGREVVERIHKLQGVPVEYFEDPQHHADAGFYAALVAVKDERDGARQEAASARWPELEKILKDRGRGIPRNRDRNDLERAVIQALLPSATWARTSTLARTWAAMHAMMVASDAGRPAAAKAFLETLHSEAPVFTHHAAALEHLHAGDDRALTESALLLALALLQQNDPLAR